MADDVTLKIEIEIENAKKNLASLNTKIIKETDKTSKIALRIEKQATREKIRLSKVTLASRKKSLSERLKDERKAAKKSKEISASSSNASIKSLKKLAVGAASTAAAIALIGKSFQFVIGEAIKIEDLQTQLIAFTGSAEAAADQIDRLAEFAGSTPFQLDELARANRTLLAFGSTTEGSIEELRQLGEASAATGADIGELARIFGQIDAAGKLTGERFLQLVERGINIGPTLAKSMGVAESSLEDLRAAGKISAEEVKKAFETLANTQYAGSLERQSQTLSGSIGILQDNTKRLGASIGKELTPFLVEAAKAATTVVKAFNDLVSEAPDIDTASGRIDILTKKIERSAVFTEILEKQLSRMGDVAEEAPQRGEFDRLTSQLDKVKGTAEKLNEELRAIGQSQQTASGRDNQAEIAKKEAEALAKIKAEEKGKADAADAERLEAITKLEADIFKVKEQQAANVRALATTESELRIQALDEEGLKLTEKLVELEVSRLELRKEFDLAAIEQAKAREEAITAAEKAEQAKREKSIIKAKKDEFAFDKIAAQEQIKFENKTALQKARAVGDGLEIIQDLQVLGGRKAFEIAKAASIAQAAIAIPETAIQSFKVGAGIGGPVLGATFAAISVAAQTAKLQQLSKAQFTAFAEGGVVPGTGNKDSVPSLLTPGEVVIPKRNFESLGLADQNTNKNDFQGIERETRRTNEILTDLVQVIGTTQSEGFLEEKFSSSTPGGIFYEAVDDGLSEQDERVNAAFRKARRTRGSSSTTFNQNDERQRKRSRSAI